MLYNILRSFARKDAEPGEKRRRFTRRAGDTCVVELTGRTYPVENWSLGGVLVFGDEKRFGIGDKVDINLKFKLTNGILDLPHKAKVVRKGMNKVALEFAPLTRKLRQDFQMIVDDRVANDFAKSQAF